MGSIAILEYWKELSAFIGFVITFLIGRKSTKIQERKNNADAVTAMQQTYDTFLTHYKEQYERILKQNKELAQKLDSNTERLNNIELRNALLSESSKEWENKYKALKIDHENLKRDFENYKENHRK